MTPHPLEFWKKLDRVRTASLPDEADAVKTILEDLGRTFVTGEISIDRARLDLLTLFFQTYAISIPQLTPLAEIAPPLPPLELPLISQFGKPGVSLVTCSMNRTGNLLKALATWLVVKDVTEIVIVDWSSTVPVQEEIRRAGLEDPRIRVIRAEDEPHWVLSYAFNVGFRVATCEKILKVDADIVLDPAFFDKNRLARRSFIAGNWRQAAESQIHVNGFFYLFKSDLAAVGGFNEYIKTYGWDDEDIYERLKDLDLTRVDVDPATISHLSHSDAERVDVERFPKKTCSALDEIRSGTMFMIRRNRFIAHVMPYWNDTTLPVDFSVLQDSGGHMTLTRKNWVPSPVSPHTEDDADYYATLEMAAWRLGPRVRNLARDQIEHLLSKPFKSLGPIDVEIVQGNNPEAMKATGGYLIVNLQTEPLPAGKAFDAAFALLTKRAKEQGLTLVLRGACPELPATAAPLLQACAFVPEWENIGTPDPIEMTDLACDLRRRPGQHFMLRFDSGPLEIPTVQSPAVMTPKAKFYIDGQHGLGNRLRAIGSAACIAEKTDRELVVVWGKDAHCNCHMNDLFAYDGAVIDTSFTDSARQKGCTLYNYMDVEKDGEKNAEIRLDGGHDIYARSAYALNSPLSIWEDENRFLRSLRPVEAVQDMLAGVRNPNDLSAHVRMVGGTEYEHLAYEASDNWTENGHRETDFWRRKSHFSHFMTRIDGMISDGTVNTIFLAADRPETYAEFQTHYGDRVATLPRTVYDRSAEQLRYALADAMLLSRAPRLLGSTWSSFSELAIRLAPDKMDMEMSGKDF